jgi:uncharacterized coiled-coil protein SlyX
VEGNVGTTEDRVASLERRAGEQHVMLDGLREAISGLDRRMASLEARMDQRFTALQAGLDQRFAAIDQRFTAIDHRFVAIDQRFVAIDQRFAALDGKISRQFLWMLGVQMTMFATLVATLLAAFLTQR